VTKIDKNQNRIEFKVPKVTKVTKVTREPKKH